MHHLGGQNNGSWRVLNWDCRGNDGEQIQGAEFYVHGSVHHESMSIIVQQDATIYSLLYFCKAALHVSGGTSTHHQKHM